jgi:hypothetical protein
MADNLSGFKFTNHADQATSSIGWDLGQFGYDSVVVNTLAGNDIIIGKSPYVGIYIRSKGTINTGIGNDAITGIGRDESGNYGDGIANYGTINTGEGDDSIKATGSGGDYGMVNNKRGKIIMGAGNDYIEVTSDRIFGSLLNDGTIDTGAGKDIVDALKGGFTGDGKTYLGSGNDTLKGFGTGSFYGGTGKDKILFSEGSYTISGSTIVWGAAPMNVNQFEQIGGANGGLFALKNGTLTVDSLGIGRFA